MYAHHPAPLPAYGRAQPAPTFFEKLRSFTIMAALVAGAGAATVAAVRYSERQDEKNRAEREREEAWAEYKYLRKRGYSVKKARDSIAKGYGPDILRKRPRVR